ncbi:MAG: hypothetical protein SVR04_16800, partial [Spirochaetota bacterium]|nr:hypothetical protein [Spirochaetota bacterium]
QTQPQPPQAREPQYVPYPVYQGAAAQSPSEQAPQMPAEPEVQEAPESPELPEEQLAPAVAQDQPDKAGEPDQQEHSEPEPLDQFYPQDPDTIEDALVDDTGLEPVGESEEGQAAGSAIDQNSAQGLFDYLTGLVEYLPDEEKAHYEESDMRLRVEALRTRLRGRGGLHAMANQLKRNGRRRESAAPGQAQGLLQKSDMLKPDTVRSAFTYLQNLSEELPNPAIGVALKQKMHDIIEKLRK